MKLQSLNMLRNAIDQRQRELVEKLEPWDTDFLLNAMQQVYYDCLNETGPNTIVYELVDRKFVWPGIEEMG